MSLKKLLKRSLKVGVITLAYTLIAVALLVSATRLALIHLDSFRFELTGFIERQYGYQVDIDVLDARWRFSGTRLELQGVRFRTPEEQHIDFSVARIFVELNLWQSLLQQDWVFKNVLLDQAHLQVVLQEGTASDFSIFDWLEPLLSKQLAHFRIQNSMIEFGYQTQAMLRLDIDELRWRASSKGRQATGYFRMPHVSDSKLRFIYDIPVQQQHLRQGRIYLETERFDLSPWLETLPHNSHIEQAEVNLVAWLDIEQGLLAGGQVHFLGNHLTWYQDQNYKHHLSMKDTLWRLTPLDKGWLLNAEPLEVVIDGHSWFVHDATWQYEHGKHGWSAKDIEIRDFGALWGLLGAPGTVVEQWSGALQPQGRIQAFAAELEQEQWRFYVQAEQLGWLPHRGLPGLTGLNIELWTTPDYGRFEVTGEQVELHSPHVFSRKQPLKELAWLGYWMRDESSWSLRMPEATLELEQASIEQQFRLSQYHGNKPMIEWSASAHSEGMNALDGLSFLPLQLGESLTNYLYEATHAGELESLHMLWRGDVEHFPYPEGQGVFQAQAWLKDVTFEFDDTWLPVYADQVHVLFKEDALTIQALAPHIGQLTTEKALVRIADLSTAEHFVVTVETEADAQVAQVADIFQQSSLRSTVGQVFEQVQLDGRVQGQVFVGIPLGEGELQLDVLAFLPSQSLHLKALQTDLTQVSGHLRMEGTQVTFQSQTAAWFGLPLTVQAVAYEDQDDYQVDVTAQSLWKSENLHTAFATHWLEPLEGELLTQAELSLRFLQAGDMAYTAQIHADLTPMQSNFPPPYAKQPGQIWFWDTQLEGNDTALSLDSRIGDVLQLHGEYQLGEPTLTFAHIYLGEAERYFTEQSGTQVALTQEQVVLTDWLSLWADVLRKDEVAGWSRDAHASEQRVSMMDYLPPYTEFVLDIEQAYVWEQPLTNLQAHASYEHEGWQGTLHAQEARVGLAKQEHDGVPLVTVDYADIIRFQRLPEVGTLAPLPFDPERTIWLDEFPAFELICRICRYDEQDIGRITLGFDPSKEGQQFKHIRLYKPGGLIDMQLGWNLEGQRKSQLQGSLSAKNISRFVQDLGWNSVIRDANTRIDMDVHWLGNVTDFSLERLDGDVHFKALNGYIEDVSDSGARLLSILSLDSVLRRLRLDFRDIFAKGLYFADFRGTIDLEQGIASTQNTIMNGAAGDMTVEGATNLVSQKLDYRLSFVPKVTSSLPVLLAWMVNPPAGVAAYLLDRVIYDTKVISLLEYQVSGSIQEPVVREIKRSETELHELEGVPFEELEN